MTQTDPMAIINNALGFGMQRVIESQQMPWPKDRIAIDFGCLDGALEAAEQLVETLGPDARVPGSHGQTAQMLRVQVLYVLTRANEFRPVKQRRQSA
jgi:hypothetical protein